MEFLGQMFYCDRPRIGWAKKHLLLVGFVFLAGTLGLAQGGTAPNGKQSATVTSRDSVEKKVRAIVVEELGVDPKKVTTKARFVEDLGADSLSMLDLQEAFEQTFNINIRKQDMNTMRTVQDAVDYISSHTKAKK